MLSEVDARNIDVSITRLREKIENNGIININPYKNFFNIKRDLKSEIHKKKSFYFN